MNVLAQLARDNKEDILSQIYDGANWMKRKFLFNRYLLQYGTKMGMALFTSRSDVTRASQLVWSVKPSQKSIQNDPKDTKLTTPNHISEISSDILSLPKDVLDPLGAKTSRFVALLNNLQIYNGISWK